MDVLKPEILFIDGMLYRKNPSYDPDINPSGEQCERNPVGGSEDYNNEEFDYYGSSSGTSEDVDPDIISQPDGSFKLVLSVPSELLRFVIGKKGESKRRVEEQTCTRILVSSQQHRDPRPEEAEVAVVGGTRTSVTSAKRQLLRLVANGRIKLPFTHFLSIPLNTCELQSSFADFKQAVLDTCIGSQGLHPGLFQSPTKLHLTLGTLVLLTKQEIKKATDLLKEVLSQLHCQQPMLVTVAGLQYMNDDPSAVDVLYAKIAAQQGALQSLVDTVCERFTEAGFIEKTHDLQRNELVKLHVTLMNTTFRNQSNSIGPQRRETFDARQILSAFSEFEFGTASVSAVHISRRFTTCPDTGYYISAAVVPI